MWYDPPAFSLGLGDAVGAWLVCLALAAACFGLPALAMAS